MVLVPALPGVYLEIVVLAGARVLWRGVTSQRGSRRWYLVRLHVGGLGPKLGPEVTLWQKIILGCEK